MYYRVKMIKHYFFEWRVWNRIDPRILLVSRILLVVKNSSDCTTKNQLKENWYETVVLKKKEEDMFIYGYHIHLFVCKLE